MTAPNSLDSLWLTEAVRLREAQAGPLDDQQASRQARAAGGDFATRLQQRAHWLAERDGMLAALRRWKQGARLALLALALFALASGAGLAFAALGGTPGSINVFRAVGSLLGLNLLLLLAWTLGMLLSRHAGASLGQLWLWLSGRLARDAQAVQLAPALLLLLQRQRLERWALGLLSNGLWLLALLSALVVLLAMMATRRYGFVWETTILGSDTFVSLTQRLGTLPAWLGFSVPDAETIRASGNGPAGLDDARQVWAGWLVGVLLIYGILPRLLLTLLCLWRWHRGRQALSLDLDDPAYQHLRERLMPASERLGVSDAAPARLHEVPRPTAKLAEGSALMVALELDDQQPWPPAQAAQVADAGVLDSRESRHRLLEQLTQNPPARLLIACDPRRSPDRGSLALLAELARNAGQTRVWLLPAPAGQQLDTERLGDWQDALQALQLPGHTQAPMNWLESGHD
ncbi:DUF2868 domain-containing protein [Pseudomonas sp. DTU_2021_1001937_2_SI_NGA_ILE_001]|uniref:DUF2868 domain-containing protein n=1 Tax=Pseudomonas sp. DTU_2021_1001937_2_SI_NGA_ILE_001 TaxID=3077589 RepID=UPI0028FC1543|nr:DUF2868 domain-containing protein [Pseudomonas sp. DTU_2021_1001937_2_SI_NGA_ILE_001]WNW12360.1 DUF2868 domain-containing protein [Pseudomonas sp. DTU_2021_1001937_2_SI_NGA_ILE_001]